MNTSLSIFARALASENVTFAFDANAETASFDVKARHLVMPVWDVSDTLQVAIKAGTLVIGVGVLGLLISQISLARARTRAVSSGY